MKRRMALALLGVLTVTEAWAAGSAAAPSQREIDLAMAPVRSRAQLDAYIASHGRTPLHRLGPQKMKTFVASLTFVPRGLGSFSYRELQGLSPAEIYDILSLFGLQSDPASTGREASTK